MGCASAHKKNVAVDDYLFELHSLSRGMCMIGEWECIVCEAAAFRNRNEQVKQKIADEEARLAEKLYELGKVQTMVFSDPDGIWQQTPAGIRGAYLLSLKQRRDIKT